MASHTPVPQAVSLHQQAQQLRFSGSSRHEDIVRLCRRAIEIDPHYAQPWALIAVMQTGRLGLEQVDGGDGWDEAQRALMLDPGLAEAHAARGRLLFGRGDREAAAAEIALALQAAPDSYDVNAVAARCFIAAKKFGDAIKYLKRAEELEQRDVWAIAMAPQCHEGRGDPSGARMAAQHAMERLNKILGNNPLNADALGYGVGLLVRLGKSRQALDWAERALATNPDNRNLQYNMACAMVQLGNFDRAIELLEPVAQVASRQGIAWFKIDTDLDALRRSPRFVSMMHAAEARLGEQAEGMISR